VISCALARSRWRVGSIGLAAAQQPTPPADAQQQSQQEKAQQTPSGKMGAEEPSSHTPNAKPQENAVFVNGALAVPGAPANTDTVPAKFSKKNAADDELITVAYTFKTLTDDERRAIYQALKGQPTGSTFNADVGPSCRPGSSCARCPMRSPPACRKPRIIATPWPTIACCWWERAGSWWGSLRTPAQHPSDARAYLSAGRQLRATSLEV